MPNWLVQGFYYDSLGGMLPHFQDAVRFYGEVAEVRPWVCCDGESQLSPSCHACLSPLLDTYDNFGCGQISQPYCPYSLNNSTHRSKNFATLNCSHGNGSKPSELTSEPFWGNTSLYCKVSTDYCVRFCKERKRCCSEQGLLCALLQTEKTLVQVANAKCAHAKDKMGCPRPEYTEG